MGRRKIKHEFFRHAAAAWREFDLIAAIRQYSQGARSGDRLGIGDDASAHRPKPGYFELVTCNALIEGVHWEWAWCDPYSLGRKTASVNLSDIAAMGGTPQRAYLVLALPPALGTPVIMRFIRGLVDTLAQYQVGLVGGDTNASTGPMLISLTLQGVVLEKQMLTRRGARPGDCLVVTGRLGHASAALRLRAVQKHHRRLFKTLLPKLLRPIPRLPEGRQLACSGKVHAMLDLSDGLAGDLRRLAEASTVGATLWAEHLPQDKSLRLAADALGCEAWELALNGGEDYELLFAIGPEHADAVCRRLKLATGTPGTVIGRVTPASQGLKVIRPDGRTVPLPRGWEHHS